LSAPRTPPWLPVEGHQFVLYVLAALLVLAVAARYGLSRWAPGRDAPRLQAGDRIDYRVDLNKADAEELDLLPGIGPAKAARIVASREAHGSFRRVSDLARVPGITEAMVEELRDLVIVSPAPEGGEPP